ncbi:TPR-like protein [Caulochytrium protostelioides]|uniref:peptidylprolyl isomerase n=1 Tax=Caulochytrium protostelioides TaxID=1555241 RepID=A0A4P9WVD2_9FUNG|nr:TPR-like protein [Caulochytrium protostelioides]
MEPKDAVEAVSKLKAIGTSYFQKGDLKAALAKYQKAIRYVHAIHPHPEELTELEESVRTELCALKISCLLNCAMCQLKLEQNRDVVKVCTQILDMVATAGKHAPNSVEQTKAYFRRGQAQTKLKQYPSAIADLKKAAELSPTDALIPRELAAAQKAQAARAAKEKAAYAKMFA